MKTLFLMRHAKSSWSHPDLKDFERPLNERGLQDIPMMVERFLQRHDHVDSIIASPATRARTTAVLFAEGIGFPQDEIISNPEFYFAGSAMFLKAARSVDQQCESVLLVGHNPAITDFSNDMCDATIDNIPTCGIVEMQLPIDDWSDITPGTGRFIHFDYPKKIL